MCVSFLLPYQILRILFRPCCCVVVVDSWEEGVIPDKLNGA